MAKKEIQFSLVYRDMWQSSGKYVPRKDQLAKIAPVIIDMGCFDRVETTEDTSDIHTLRMLHLVHEFAHIRWHRVHTQCVETTVQHVGLDTYLVERLGEGAYCYIGILAVE